MEAEERERLQREEERSMEQEELDRRVQHIFTNITSQLEQLDEPPSLCSLCRLVEYTRGKKLIHNRRRLTPGLTAFGVALREQNLICTCVDADEPLEETAFAHECVHFLVWDIPHISMDMEFPEFFVRLDDLLADLCGQRSGQRMMVFRRLEKTEAEQGAFVMQIEAVQSGFETPREYIAEKVAALLVDYFEQYRLSVPNSAVIFGYTVP